MSTTDYFRVIPGTVHKPGDVPLSDFMSNIEPVVKPRGRVKAQLLDRLTGTYNAFEQAQMMQTWLSLRTTGLINRLDGLFIRGTNPQDSVLNWVFGRPDALNMGAAWSREKGFTTDGVGTWVDFKFTRNHFTMANASWFINIPDGEKVLPDTPVLGRPVGLNGAQASRLSIETGTEGQASGRVNISTRSLIGQRPDNTDMSGLWIGNVYNGTRASVTQRNKTITDQDLTPNAIQEGIAIGTDNGSSWGVVSANAFGYGSNLQSADRQLLQDILTRHLRFI